MAFVAGAQKRDRNAEVNGVWYEYDEDTKFLVARANNPAYKSFIQREYAANERALERKNEHADKLAESITLEAICRHILLDWKGVIDQDGNSIPYSPEIAMKILEEEDELRVELYQFASDRANYLQKHEEEAVEALGKS